MGKEFSFFSEKRVKSICFDLISMISLLNHHYYAFYYIFYSSSSELSSFSFKSPVIFSIFSISIFVTGASNSFYIGKCYSYFVFAKLLCLLERISFMLVTDGGVCTSLYQFSYHFLTICYDSII